MAISKFPASRIITKEFTSSGTWVCPGGVTSAEFLVVGAGGGGGGAYTANNTQISAGGGGGGGAVKLVRFPVTPGSTYTVTVGAKGNGGTNAVGGNGGFSEVILSGTTLIRSLGGAGGGGVNTTPAAVVPTEAAWAGGFGSAITGTDATICSGGGGGAQLGNQVNETGIYVAPGSEGGPGRSEDTNPDRKSRIVGGAGINGFGAGGNGATINTSTPVNYQPCFGAGIGAVVNSTGTAVQNGGNASIAGCGGGGAGNSKGTLVSSTGGNGADGLVRITYYV